MSITYAFLILLRNRRSLAWVRGSHLQVTFAFISHLGHMVVSPGLGIWGHEDFTVLLAARSEVHEAKGTCDSPEPPNSTSKEKAA